jgi:hypothetical protein
MEQICVSNFGTKILTKYLHLYLHKFVQTFFILLQKKHGNIIFKRLLKIRAL